MLSVRDCIIVCHCYDMQQRSPECSVSLVGANQASVTVNNGSTVAQQTQSRPRGVVITPLDTTRHAASSQGQRQIIVCPSRTATTVIPKVLVKAVCKSVPKKDACVKTFTLRNVDIEQVSTRDQLKAVIRSQLTDDVIIRGDFDVGYYQASTVVTIRSPQDVREVWNDVKQGCPLV